MRLIEARETVTGTLKHSQWSYQRGADVRVRFAVHRLRAAERPARALRGAIILVHGQLADFSVYTATASQNAADPFAGALANAGYDVYGYDPPHALLGPDACTTTVDCSVMRDWGMQSVLDDLTVVRAHVASSHPRQAPVIGGWSFGGMIALAAVNQDPRAYSGALVWEALLSLDDPSAAIMGRSWR